MMQNRVGFIGGSDINQILSEDWLDLWEVKTGIKQPKDLSNVLPVQMGVVTEDLNISWFSQQTQKEVVGQQEEFTLELSGVPFKGTVDGRIKEENCILEAKHTNANNSMGRLMVYYKPQMQLYCGLSGSEGCYLSAIFGNNRWEFDFMLFDEDYFDRLVGLTASFWHCVTSGIKPDFPNFTNKI
jgi:hypothetical protein